MVKDIGLHAPHKEMVIKAMGIGSGEMLVGVGQASGEAHTEQAARIALSDSLSERPIHDAQRLLVSISGDETLTQKEVEQAIRLIEEAVDPNAEMIWGRGIDKGLTDTVNVTIVASGFGTIG